jgi:hypothetical protein
MRAVVVYESIYTAAANDPAPCIELPQSSFGVPRRPGDGFARGGNGATVPPMCR